jgi:hypothetical protein
MWKVFVLGTKYLYQNTLLTHFPDGFKLQGWLGRRPTPTPKFIYRPQGLKPQGKT